MYSRYDAYLIFKEIESEVKGKPFKPLTEEMFLKRTSEKNLEHTRKISNIFNTRFQNVNLRDYIKCGFHHFKSFDYDKMFRDVVLQEYIARDNRIKRNPEENITKIMSDMKYINRYLDSYVNEHDGNQRIILKDYIHNNIGSTILVYSIWRSIFKPDSFEWEYMSTIKNNFPLFEKNAIKFAPMIDKWRTKMKAER